MEENTVSVNEIEETQPDVDMEVDMEEASESSGSGAFVAGVVGGFLAYAFISGAKKFVSWAYTKVTNKSQKKAAATMVDAEYNEIPDEQETSEENDSDEK